MQGSSESNQRANRCLKNYNTFGINVEARYFASITDIDTLRQLIVSRTLENQDFCILGEGSNTIFRTNYEGHVLKNDMKGIQVLQENEDAVWVEAQGGENWHEFVQHCIRNGWGGIENLSLIPGSVGAAPVQNIGAYGVELKDVFESLIAVNMRSGRVERFSLSACRFGYRDSIFKNRLQGRYFIVSVILKLTKQDKHQFTLSYGAIKERLEASGQKPSLQSVSDTVCEIRREKLPDPRVLGNCGSFFKNVVLTKNKFEKLQKRFPDMPHYIIKENQIKIPTAWLIEQCGEWKGRRFGNIGIYHKHALIIVNHGGGTGREVSWLSEKIIESVHEKFGIEIEREVNII